jgi:hypothetical protein
VNVFITGTVFAWVERMFGSAGVRRFLHKHATGVLNSMSEVYNPETLLRQRIEALEIEARTLVSKRDTTPANDDRQVLERMLSEIEARVTSLRRMLRR